MTYQKLDLNQAAPQVVKQVIRDAIEPVFRDIHCMLRLPIKARGLEAGCNFAIAHSLLPVICGISEKLYDQRGGARERFIGLMVNHYWPFDPPWFKPRKPKKAAYQEAAEILWKEFRLPFAHKLGLLEIATHRRKVMSYQGLSEKEVVFIERSSDRPGMKPTLQVRRNDANVLLVEGLYWGTRRMLERLTSNAVIMQHAEKRLSRLTGSNELKKA